MLVINKTDLVSVEERDELRAILHKLNSAASIIEAEQGRVPLGSVLNTRLFDLEKVQSSAGWIKELSSTHTPETEEYGISSFVFRARRPFHPERFWYFIHTEWPGLLRSKGYFWLATRHDFVGAWSQAGGSAEHRPAGMWWAAAPEDQLPDDKESLRSIKKEWQEPFGDRRQELVLIGQNLPKDEMIQALDDCLLNDREMAYGPAKWAVRLPDPFPDWIADPTELESNHDEKRSI